MSTSIPVAAPIEATITTLAEFAATAAGIAATGVRWFRGTSKDGHTLIPSLYRHPTIREPDKLIDLEWELLSEFRHQAPPFAGPLPEKPLELLFLMQHFGVPTRLLDWSESPFIALFFALEKSREMGADAYDAAVWVLDPIKLNERATAHMVSGLPRIFGAYADELRGYEPSAEGRRVTMKLPMAIYGVHNSPRIVAQRGAFVMFGKDPTPLDQNPDLSGAGGVVKKIVISASSKKTLLSDLYNIGVSDSVVYPDLDGLGREIKNRRGF